MDKIKQHVPNLIDKQLLVWYKKYPSRDKVPHSVNETMMKKVHNKARVHGSLIMMGFAIVGYIIAVFEGRRAVKRGESVEKMNFDFHKQYERMHKDK